MGMKETIVFITPAQPHIDIIRSKGYTVKLLARRTSDGYISKKKFDFDYLPHDYYDPCFFCFENPDNNPESSRAKLVPMKEVARPGLRKRQMSLTENTEIHERKIKVKGDEHIKLLNMNRPPVIKTTTSITNTSLQILPTLTLIPVTQLQRANLKIDSLNKIEKTSIKTEPIDEQETKSSSPRIIPYHDIANNLIKTLPSTVVTNTSPSSLIFPIKKEL